MNVRYSGNSTLFIGVSEKARSPILYNDSGRIRSPDNLDLLKALYFIVLTEEGKTQEIVRLLGGESNDEFARKHENDNGKTENNINSKWNNNMGNPYETDYYVPFNMERELNNLRLRDD